MEAKSSALTVCHRGAFLNINMVVNEGRFLSLSNTVVYGALLFLLQVVGSVLYFTSFCLDRLGQPLLNDNPQLTEGWEVPKYPSALSMLSEWTSCHTHAHVPVLPPV